MNPERLHPRGRPRADAARARSATRSARRSRRSPTTASATTCTTRPAPRRSRRATCSARSPTAKRANQLAIASMNVENLDPTDPPDKFARLASIVVDNLRSPDILAVEEIQDNNGAADAAPTTPSRPTGGSSTAIQAAGGPSYQYRQINPVSGHGRRRARRQHPRRLPLPHRRRPPVRRPAGGDGEHAEQRDRDRRRAPRLTVQPGPHRPDRTRRSTTAASRWRPSSLEGPDGVRDREPLQLEGRGRSAGRALPAAGGVLDASSGTSRRTSSTASSSTSSRPTRAPRSP